MNNHEHYSNKIIFFSEFYKIAEVFCINYIFFIGTEIISEKLKKFFYICNYILEVYKKNNLRLCFNTFINH